MARPSLFKVLIMIATAQLVTTFAHADYELWNCNFKKLPYAAIIDNGVAYDGGPQLKTRPIHYQCNDLRPLDDLVNDILSKMPGVPPPVLNLYSQPPPNDGSDLGRLAEMSFGGPASNNIEVGYDLRPGPHQDSVRQRFVHELGHALFMQLLAEQIPLYRAQAQVFLRDQQSLQTFKVIFQRQGSDPNCRALEDIDYPRWPARNTCAQFIKNYLRENGLEKEYLSADIGDDELPEIPFKEFSDNYNELFADMTAAIYYASPDIIYSSLLEVLGQSYSNQLQCRKFSVSMPTSFDSKDPHCKLSAIRHELWKQKLEPELVNPNKFEALFALGRIMVAEIKKQEDLGKTNASAPYLVDSLRKSLNLKP